MKATGSPTEVDFGLITKITEKSIVKLLLLYFS